MATDRISDEQLEAGASALVDSCIGKGHWKHATDASKAVYRKHAEAVLRAVLALQPEPTVEQAIASLKIALRDSKGWTMGYSDAIIRDAIDRAPEPCIPKFGARPAQLRTDVPILKARLLGVDFDYCESGKTVLMFDWPRTSVSADCDWTVDEALAASPKTNGGN